MPERTFTKIKRNFSTPGVTLAWQVASSNPKKPERVAINFPEPQSDDFNGAFDRLAEYVTEPCGMTKQQTQTLRVLGVTMTNTNGKIQGVILAARSIEGYSPKAENMPRQTFDGLLLKAAQELDAHAVAYIDGERGQLTTHAEEDADDEQQLQEQVAG